MLTALFYTHQSLIYGRWGIPELDENKKFGTEIPDDIPDPVFGKA